MKSAATIYALVIPFSEVWERLNSHSMFFGADGSVQHEIHDVSGTLMYLL